MAGSTFGTLFRLTTFGESHGVAIGGIIEGCPAGIEIDEQLIALWMDRRKPGQSDVTSPRKEADIVELLSGIFENKTTGTPIGFLIRNKDQASADYDYLKSTFRPSHADFTFTEKYGIRDHRGGGRSSARETACRVAGGAIAMQLLQLHNISIHGWVSSVGTITAPDNVEINDAAIFGNSVRCPHPETAAKMEALIRETAQSGDSLGGVISCVVNGLPVGLGEPVFDKLHADLAKAMMSINATKGFEYGMGFAASRMKGSEHNDAFIKNDTGITTATNRSGGIQGGISNGQPILFRTAFKPVATIMKDQVTVNAAGEQTVLKNKGRHDPCVVPRAVPIVVGMTALVIADHLLRQRSAQL
ncbi:MAG TPA: chorismate synthase [Bacteroidia bacterium]|nr:chorismate synthase [Bacteroidia bacterium]